MSSDMRRMILRPGLLVQSLRRLSMNKQSETAGAVLMTGQQLERGW